MLSLSLSPFLPQSGKLLHAKVTMQCYLEEEAQRISPTAKQHLLFASISFKPFMALQTPSLRCWRTFSSGSCVDQVTMVSEVPRHVSPCPLSKWGVLKQTTDMVVLCHWSSQSTIVGFQMFPVPGLLSARISELSAVPGSGDPPRCPDPDTPGVVGVVAKTHSKMNEKIPHMSPIDRVSWYPPKKCTEVTVINCVEILDSRTFG